MTGEWTPEFVNSQVELAWQATDEPWFVQGVGRGERILGGPKKVIVADMVGRKHAENAVYIAAMANHYMSALQEIITLNMEVLRLRRALQQGSLFNAPLVWDWTGEEEDKAWENLGEDGRRESSDLIDKMIAAAREYGEDVSIDTANQELKAEIKLRAEIAAKDAEIERLKRLLTIESDDEGDEL